MREGPVTSVVTGPFYRSASAAVALVGVLVGILILVAVLVLVLILIGVLVLVLVGILVLIVVHEDTSFDGCPMAGAVMMPVGEKNMRENYQKKMQIIVDTAKMVWYNTPENKEGRCIRPHLQQWQRG